MEALNQPGKKRFSLRSLDDHREENPVLCIIFYFFSLGQSGTKEGQVITVKNAKNVVEAHQVRALPHARSPILLSFRFSMLMLVLVSESHSGLRRLHHGPRLARSLTPWGQIANNSSMESSTTMSLMWTSQRVPPRSSCRIMHQVRSTIRHASLLFCFCLLIFLWSA